MPAKSLRNLRNSIKLYWIGIGIGEIRVIVILHVVLNSNPDILGHTVWMRCLWLFIQLSLPIHSNKW